MPTGLGNFIKKTVKDVMDYGVHIKHLTQVFIVLSQVNGRIWNSEMEPVILHRPMTSQLQLEIRPIEF